MLLENPWYCLSYVGVCELELGNHQEALDSLKKANVSDTSNC